ncbi:MAG: hypothetical protein JSV09_11845 [Thermoplasmata archaeon]|nr:MAG: hypothetical protein JSV09_11845 [Thermoplasmata archaeon]
MKESELFADCRCINCRIGRIEKRLTYIQNLIEPINQSMETEDATQDENNPLRRENMQIHMSK